MPPAMREETHLELIKARVNILLSIEQALPQRVKGVKRDA
jgi:hypothetical protein